MPGGYSGGSPVSMAWLEMVSGGFKDVLWTSMSYGMSSLLPSDELSPWVMEDGEIAQPAPPSRFTVNIMGSSWGSWCFFLDSWDIGRPYQIGFSGMLRLWSCAEKLEYCDTLGESWEKKWDFIKSPWWWKRWWSSFLGVMVIHFNLGGLEDEWGEPHDRKETSKSICICIIELYIYIIYIYLYMCISSWMIIAYSIVMNVHQRVCHCQIACAWNTSPSNYSWLVVTGTMEFYVCFHILGMSSSHLTNSKKLSG